MIDINSYDSGQLHLNGVMLPEIQRRKTEEDERQMRQFLCENDLVVAEVQLINNQDKAISIHIRNDKFGKLKNGFLTKVSSDLIKKQTRHMVDLSMGIKLILGMNGWIWLEALDP
jgi:exosome complex component RRP4